MNIKYGGRQPRGGAKKCIPLTLSLTIDSSVTVSHLIWLLALCEESQSCVWFGANSKTRVLANPWDQALSVGLTSSRNALITFSRITPNTYWNRFISAVVQSYLNNRLALFGGKFTELAKVACFTCGINVRIVFCHQTVFCHDISNNIFVIIFWRWKAISVTLHPSSPTENSKFWG